MSSKKYTEADMKKYDTSPFIHKKDNDIVVLSLHGLLASAQQMIYINKSLSDKYSVVCPNLIGHGSKLDDLKGVKYIDWVNQLKTIISELNQEYKKVFIVGLSTYGIIFLKYGVRYIVDDKP